MSKFKSLIDSSVKQAEAEVIEAEKGDVKE